jgi:hypothetical protein
MGEVLLLTHLTKAQPTRQHNLEDNTEPNSTSTWLSVLQGVWFKTMVLPMNLRICMSLHISPVT